MAAGERRSKSDRSSRLTMPSLPTVEKHGQRPGAVEQKIAAIIDAEPDNAFTIEDLCERVYDGLRQVEKKHRVAVIRAAKKLAHRRNSLTWYRGTASGGTLVFFLRDNVLSYGMARKKMLPSYRNNDPRRPWSYTEADLRQQLSVGGLDNRLIVEGGAWWQHVHVWLPTRSCRNHVSVPKKTSRTDQTLRALRPRP
jgi:hypothetical protein